MNNYKYVGLFLVILTFGILFIPKIINRISSDTIVQDGRSKSANPLIVHSIAAAFASSSKFTVRIGSLVALASSS